MTTPTCRAFPELTLLSLPRLRARDDRADADEGAWFPLLIRALRHPVAVARTGRLLCRLPVVQIEVTDSHAGQAIRRVVEHRRLGLPTGRLARSALAIPADADAYTKGSRRQALRTNVARAKRQGVVAERVQPAALTDIARRVADDAWREHLMWSARTMQPYDDSSAICIVANDVDGTALAVAAAIVDDKVAYLTAHISSHQPAASDARYLVALGLVDALAAQGVAVLFSTSALSMSRNLAYFGHLLGFAPCNLQVRHRDALPT